MSDNNSANNMSDTSFTTPTNQGIGQVPMTPSPPPRSLVPPPAPNSPPPTAAEIVSAEA